MQTELSNGMLVTEHGHCFQWNRQIKDNIPINSYIFLPKKKVDQAAKDEMLCISHVTLRALQGSCNLGAKVEVWFSLVLKYLSHCLPLNGSKVSVPSTNQDLKGKAYLWSKNQIQDKVL